MTATRRELFVRRSIRLSTWSRWLITHALVPLNAMSAGPSPTGSRATTRLRLRRDTDDLRALVVRDPDGAAADPDVVRGSDRQCDALDELARLVDAVQRAARVERPDRAEARSDGDRRARRAGPTSSSSRSPCRHGSHATAPYRRPTRTCPGGHVIVGQYGPAAAQTGSGCVPGSPAGASAAAAARIATPCTPRSWRDRECRCDNFR